MVVRIGMFNRIRAKVNLKLGINRIGSVMPLRLVF